MTIDSPILVKGICTKKEYQGTYLQSETNNFLAEYDVAELLVELCNFAGIDTERMYLLENFQVSAPLQECSSLLHKSPEAQQARIKEYAFSEMLLYRDKNTNQRARSDKNLLLKLTSSQRDKLLEDHHRQIVEPVKEGVKKVLSSSARLDSSEELKKALENELATNIKDGKTLKVRGKEFAKSWNEELEAQNTILYPLHTTRTALHSLNRVSCEGFERLSTDQKTELSDILGKLKLKVQHLIDGLEKVK